MGNTVSGRWKSRGNDPQQFDSFRADAESSRVAFAVEMMRDC